MSSEGRHSGDSFSSPPTETVQQDVLEGCDLLSRDLEMSSNPAFVLVPGNFLPPSYYASSPNHLELHGFQTHLVTLQGTSSNSPLTSNEPDVAAARKVLEKLCESGNDILVVADSYSSIPTYEAANSLGSEESRELGKSGGIERLIQVTAWLYKE